MCSTRYAEGSVNNKKNFYASPLSRCICFIHTCIPGDPPQSEDLPQSDETSIQTTPPATPIQEHPAGLQTSLLDNKPSEEFVLSFKADSSSDSEPDGVVVSGDDQPSGDDEPSGDPPANQAELSDEDSPGMITSRTTVTVS